MTPVRNRYLVFLAAVMAVATLAAGCVKPQINIFPDMSEPLEEYTLEGKAREKVVMIPVRGFLSDTPGERFFQSRPSPVEEIVSHFDKAAEDDDVKAVVLKINSPGGTTTASDILYSEIVNLKKRRDVKVIAAMMDVAASGGYYICLPADRIVAHPTTVTGSVGVIFIRPKVVGLMDKLGLDVEVNASGKNKDMGSPFRPTTEDEEQIVQKLIADLGGRFAGLVKSHRNLDGETLKAVSTGRVFLAGEALQLGLIDRVGYLRDALSEAKNLAGLPEDAKVVVYRRTEYANDNIYNSATAQSAGRDGSLVDLNPFSSFTDLPSGFHYLWLPAANGG